MGITTEEWRSMSNEWVQARRLETGSHDLSMEDFKDFLKAFPEHLEGVEPSEEVRKYWMYVHGESPLSL